MGREKATKTLKSRMGLCDIYTKMGATNWINDEYNL